MKRWAVYVCHNFQNSVNVDVKGDTGSDGSVGIVGPGDWNCFREGLGKGNKEPDSGTWKDE